MTFEPPDLVARTTIKHCLRVLQYPSRRIDQDNVDIVPHLSQVGWSPSVAIPRCVRPLTVDREIEGRLTMHCTRSTAALFILSLLSLLIGDTAAQAVSRPTFTTGGRVAGQLQQVPEPRSVLRTVQSFGLLQVITLRRNPLGSVICVSGRRRSEMCHEPPLSAVCR